MFERVKNLFSASQLTPPPLPKSPNAPQSLPGYRTSLTPSTSAKTKPERNLKSLDRLVDLRARATTSEVLREMSVQSGEVSAAVNLALRTGIPERFTLIGRNLDGQVDAASTNLAHELLRRLTYLNSVDGSSTRRAP